MEIRIRRVPAADWTGLWFVWNSAAVIRATENSIAPNGAGTQRNYSFFFPFYGNGFRRT